MRSDATFIGIEVDDAIVDDAALAAKLEEVCPVSIYANEGGKVDIVESNIDECILCGLCIKASDGKVTVHKLYSGETLTAA
jgi:NAD-dependent dihydropyrimidine dehydrogenase PreA subunit